MKLQKAFSVAALSAAAMFLASVAIADAPGDEYSESTYIPKARIVKRHPVARVETVHDVVVVHEGRMARSLSEIGAIRVGGSVCDTDIAKQLDDHGFLVASTSGANAILEVNMETNGNLSHPHTVEKGAYQASLIGANGRVLFSTAGHENAHNLASLCEDVGQDIADRLEDRTS